MALDPARPSLSWWGFGALAPLSLFIAASLVLISAVAGYQVAGRRSPTYVSYSATMLDQPITVAQSQDAGVIDKLARLRLKYAGLLRSDVVTEAAATDAGVSRGAVAGAELVRVDPGSLLLYVGASSTSPKQAARLANALAKALSAYVSGEQRNAAIAPKDRVELKVLAPARGATQVLPTKRQKLTSAAGGALVVFVIVAGALDVMRRRTTRP